MSAETTSKWQENDLSGFQTRDMIRFFVVDITLTVFIWLLRGLGFFPAPDHYVLAILAGKALLLSYLVWLVRDRRAAWKETGAATLGRWWGWLVALLAYAGAYPALMFADRFNIALVDRVCELFGWRYEPQVQDAVILIFDKVIDTPAKLILILFTVLVGPIMEELAFRGVGLDAYRRRYGLTAALIWTSLLFGLYHLTMHLLIPLSIMGAVFCVARVLSRSLWCAVLVHCVHNFLTLALTARHLGIVEFPWFS